MAQALARLLADVRGSAGSGQPRHARSRRQHRPRLHGRTTRRRTPRLIAQAEEPARATSTATSTWCRGTCSSASASRWPASRTRTAPSASATIRATSALDVHCRAHDVDNLYVVDGSFFPSSAAVNPALTIAANALRVGDHLLERLGVASRRRRWPCVVRCAPCVAASLPRPSPLALALAARACWPSRSARRRPPVAAAPVSAVVSVGMTVVGHGPRRRLLHARAAVPEDLTRPRRRAGRASSSTACSARGCASSACGSATSGSS